MGAKYNNYSGNSIIQSGNSEFYYVFNVKIKITK